MPTLKGDNDPFFSRLNEAIEAHIEEEAFGVAELAHEMNMSRSTLLRRVKSGTGLSASLYIRRIRLQHAKELLQVGELTVSEIAYKVGFSSSSYFTKCFREEYGYTPSEEGQQVERPNIEASQEPEVFAPKKRTKIGLWSGLIAGIALVLGIGFLLNGPKEAEGQSSPKTIAVLPFQNDSQDSSNVYLVNGLMVALIDNLHQIQDLQVTSRTTIERYRGLSRTIPELAAELGVSYFVEGSGQKMGDKILLTLRLIDGQADTLIWSRRYQRETTDIFQLQTEVSTSIAEEIEAYISPEEQQKLQLAPTENLLAYDHYLKGLEQIKRENRDDLILGIASLQKAIAEDPQFAHPHAYLAISYYFLDLYQVEKKHVEDINTYADKAFLLDPELNESLIGKALYYMQTGQFELAIQFFDKVLRKDPGSGWVHNLLSTIYSLHLPNTQNYLRHALQGINYAVAGQDSNTISFAYLHLGNSLAQNGFLAESVPFLEKSLQYQAGNLFSETLAIYVQLGLDNDFDLAYQRFQTLLAKDTSFLSSLHETAKLALYQRKYEEAWEYYSRFLAIRQQSGLNVYQGEDINIAFVLDQLGRKTEADRFRARYFEYLQSEETAFQDLGYAAYYTAIGENAKAISALKAFAQQDNFQYWLILYIEQDPMFESLEGEADYAETIQAIKDNFWLQHQQMRTELQEEGLI